MAKMKPRCTYACDGSRAVWTFYEWIPPWTQERVYPRVNICYHVERTSMSNSRSFYAAAVR